MLWANKFVIKGIPKCYGWPYIQVADGTILIGKNVRLGSIKLIVAKGGRLIIEDNVGINDGSVIGVMEEVCIGTNTAIAEYVMIRDHDHNYSEICIGQSSNGYKIDRVKIGKGCWIGYGSVLTKGVSLSDGVIVGANSVVTKSINKGEIVGGVPAKKIAVRS